MAARALRAVGNIGDAAMHAAPSIGRSINPATIRSMASNSASAANSAAKRAKEVAEAAAKQAKEAAEVAAKRAKDAAEAAAKKADDAAKAAADNAAKTTKVAADKVSDKLDDAVKASKAAPPDMKKVGSLASDSPLIKTLSKNKKLIALGLTGAGLATAAVVLQEKAENAKYSIIKTETKEEPKPGIVDGLMGMFGMGSDDKKEEKKMTTIWIYYTSDAKKRPDMLEGDTVNITYINSVPSLVGTYKVKIATDKDGKFAIETDKTIAEHATAGDFKYKTSITSQIKEIAKDAGGIVVDAAGNVAAAGAGVAAEVGTKAMEGILPGSSKYFNMAKYAIIFFIFLIIVYYVSVIRNNMRSGPQPNVIQNQSPPVQATA